MHNLLSLGVLMAELWGIWNALKDGLGEEHLKSVIIEGDL